MLLDFLGSLFNECALSMVGVPMPCPHSGPQPVACRKIMLVENRDDVFGRLAADLTAAGFRVERAVRGQRSEGLCLLSRRTAGGEC